MGKAKGDDKKASSSKDAAGKAGGKAKGKGDKDAPKTDSSSKTKAAQSINVRHILVGSSSDPGCPLPAPNAWRSAE